MFSIKHAKDMMSLLMTPWKVKPGIYHFKITRAITEPTVSRLLSQLRQVKKEKPQVLMLSINSAVGSFAQAQRAHDAFKQTSFELQVPLYTFADDMALGVGYYLLSAGSTVHANPFSLIGDFSLHQRKLGFTKLLSKHNLAIEKIGNSLLLDAFENVTAENKQFITNHLDHELQELMDQVRQNRKANPSGIINLKEIRNFLMWIQLILLYFPEFVMLNKPLSMGSLVDEISTFEEFRGQYYPESVLKEVSMEQETTAESIIKAQLETKLVVSINTILQQAVESPSNMNIKQIENDLIVLLERFLKSDKNSYQVLGDIVANVVNQQMINGQCNKSY